MQKSTLATYVWLDADGSTRSKVKVLKEQVRFLRDLPVWNFDGSSTGQSSGKYSDVLLKPQRLYTDPFRGKPHVIVMCDCWDEVDEPNLCNSRTKLKEKVDQNKIENSMVKLEQTYIIMNRVSNTPFRWKEYKTPGFKDNTYYCGTGGPGAYGQRIVEKHAELCLQAGVSLMAYSAEKMPGMWRFELEEMETLKAFDDLVIAKYIMCLLSEKHQVYPTFDPKPHFAEKVGPQLIINLPHPIQPDTLATAINQPITVQDFNGEQTRLTLKDGCKIIYDMMETSTTTSDKYVKERVAACGPTTERRSVAKPVSKIANGVDGYLLMAEILKMRSE